MAFPRLRSRTRAHASARTAVDGRNVLRVSFFIKGTRYNTTHIIRYFGGTRHRVQPSLATWHDDVITCCVLLTPLPTPNHDVKMQLQSSLGVAPCRALGVAGRGKKRLEKRRTHPDRESRFAFCSVGWFAGEHVGPQQQAAEASLNRRMIDGHALVTHSSSRLVTVALLAYDLYPCAGLSTLVLADS